MNRRSARTGTIAALGLSVFYVTTVWGASGSFRHLLDQTRDDWYLLLAIVVGFGVQVGLVAELRRRHRLHGTPAVAGGAGIGASTIGMVACCAHHVADLAPLIAATGAATVLTDYRIPFMVAGIGANTVGVLLAARRLHHASHPSATPRGAACAHA